MAIAATQNQIQALLESSNGSSASKAAQSKTDEAQDRFLKLLTTQLKNQDPLNPMENAEMTSQLAQISTVDGIEKLNATLQKLLSSTADAEAMQAAAMIGHQVMVPGKGLSLSEGGAVGAVDVKSFSDRVTVNISDPNGLLMKSVELGRLQPGLHNFTWDGTTDAGVRAVNGNYTITVEAKRGSDKVDASPLELAGVMSISRDSGGVKLDLGRLGLVSMTDIKQIF